jgi:hypothetical protein
VSKRAHFQPTQIQRHFAGYRRHGIFICGIAVGLGACLYGHHFVKAEARAATAEYDDETPDEEGEPNPADERQETFERLRARVFMNLAMNLAQELPIVLLLWFTNHGRLRLFTICAGAHSLGVTYYSPATSQKFLPKGAA